MGKCKTISLVIDNKVLEQYTKHHFNLHPRATVPPIKHPYHESINTWMILRRPAMNALKQKWKDFIKWFIEEQGYTNLHIERCEISQTIYYPTERRHDVDNTTPKFVLDGLVESGMVVDDDSKHIQKLILQCGIDKQRPRTVLKIKVLECDALGVTQNKN